MNICNGGFGKPNHVEICFEQKDCPLCDIMKDLEELVEKNCKLETEIEVKDDNIAHLNDLLRSVDLID